MLLQGNEKDAAYRLEKCNACSPLEQGIVTEPSSTALWRRQSAAGIQCALRYERTGSTSAKLGPHARAKSHGKPAARQATAKSVRNCAACRRHTPGRVPNRGRACPTRARSGCEGGGSCPALECQDVIRIRACWNTEVDMISADPRGSIKTSNQLQCSRAAQNRTTVKVRVKSRGKGSGTEGSLLVSPWSLRWRSHKRGNSDHAR
mmetsp:Transcript_103790/g.317845  ORF Transcript_103790/g.317845 Transcript_103790/m.317845 type:complete len:205 (-) Transcript_103790:2041-2655(-)